MFNLFAGWCKRHPPDGCENPDAETHTSSRDVNCSKRENEANQQNIENAKKLKLTSPVIPAESRDVNHNNENSETSAIDKCADHHYVVFEEIKARPRNGGNPVIRSLTEGRVVLDQKAYNTTPGVSECLDQKTYNTTPVVSEGLDQKTYNTTPVVSDGLGTTAV